MYEMDPQRTNFNELVVNQSNLESLTQKILDSLFDNIHLFPASLKKLCSEINRIVNLQFANAGRTAVSGFIFLRIICPTIASPDQNLISQPITCKNTHRGLVLVSKIVQNLGNFVMFGGKEFFMEPLNNFLVRNQQKFADYISEISVIHD